jgi:uncharacterized protein (TIGR00251 family)
VRWSDCYDVDDEPAAGGAVIRLRVHVQPSAGRTAVVGRHGDAVKLRVAAPPVDDRANDAVVALLADVAGGTPSAVEVVPGPRSRAKRVRVRGVGPDALDGLLDGAVAQESGSRRGSGAARSGRH